MALRAATIANSGQIVGTNTNDNAGAGIVGEYISASVAFASPTSITTGTGISLCSISLTPGDWDVTGVVTFNGAAATTLQYAAGGISTVNNTLTASGLMSRTDLSYGTAGVAVFAANQVGVSVGPLRVSLSATTTHYLVAQAGFGTSTANACGFIRARRVR